MSNESNGYADPHEVAEFAQGLSISHLHCRELGHNWRPHAARRAEDGGSFERVLRCVRCKTLRIQVLSIYGAVVSSHYEYPDGYISKGLGRIVGDGRDRLRLETTMRMMEPVD